MISYPFNDITINGRSVSIDSIIRRQSVPQSDFEQKTFAFIADWLEERESFIQLTSGSTGTPKQIIITRAQMIASATMSIQALGLQWGDNALVCISPDYIGGKMMLVRCLTAGLKVIALTPSSNPFETLPSEQQIEFAAMVPMQVHEIVRSKKAARFNELKTVIVGGASLDAKTEEMLQAYSCMFYSTYGMTETLSHVALRQLNGSAASEHYRTLPGIEISLDERNCLVIHWDQLAGNVVTNDIVEIVTPNSFRWIGRWDNVINSGGVKVIPEKVELQIKDIFDLNAVKNHFFIGAVPDSRLGNKVVLFIEGYLSNELVEMIEQAMAQIIPKTERPKQIILINFFTVTENGKINRKDTIKSYMKAM